MSHFQGGSPENVILVYRTLHKVGVLYAFPYDVGSLVDSIIVEHTVYVCRLESPLVLLTINTSADKTSKNSKYCFQTDRRNLHWIVLNFVLGRCDVNNLISIITFIP